MDETYLNSASGKRGSWALKFEESLTEYSIALEEERNTSTMVITSFFSTLSILCSAKRDNGTKQSHL